MGLVGNLGLQRREWVEVYSRRSIHNIIRLINTSMAAAHAIACLGRHRH